MIKVYGKTIGKWVVRSLEFCIIPFCNKNRINFQGSTLRSSEFVITNESCAKSADLCTINFWFRMYVVTTFRTNDPQDVSNKYIMHSDSDIWWYCTCIAPSYIFWTSFPITISPFIPNTDLTNPLTFLHNSTTSLKISWELNWLYKRVNIYKLILHISYLLHVYNNMIF